MITVDTVDLVKDLQKFKLEAERKLKNMVENFAGDVTLAASTNTPEGNEEDLIAGLSGYGTPANRSYANLYRQRQTNYSINTETGFHKGAWYYSTTPMAPFSPVINDARDAAQQVQEDINANYKIGEAIYIVSSGPGFSSLEAGVSLKAPDGIMQPTEKMILTSYQINLKQYYDRG